ncbi:MAG: cytochrome c [Saprospiraceae bacterium]|nr:cytochrome c [Saprospiraceae bacterium]
MRLQEFQRLYYLRIFNCLPLCYFIYFFLFLALVFGACTEESKMGEQMKEVAKETLAQQEIAHFDLEFLLGNEHGFVAEEIMVKYDHTLKHEQNYKAYRFSQVLDTLLAQGDYDWIRSADPAKILITYKCVDGYNASMTMDKALSQESYLAFTDLTSESEAWTGKMASKMPPLYLVWEEVPYDDHSLIWPYGLSKLTITPYEAAYASIMPKENLAGFKLYETHCLKCHSLSKIGGVMGPEFNYPRNILTYWKEDDIWAFINDPKSFRYSSKMPPITYLQRSEFDEIVKYLRELDSMPRDPS